MIRCLYLTILLCLAASAPGAWAEGGTTLHGFASLGFSCSNNTEADFVYDTHPSGPGRTRHCDAGTDSLFGVQGDVPLMETLTGAVQITSQRSAWNNFKPTVTNANLRWSASDDISVRFGRVNSPLFLYSDHRLVHFALPTIRPPPEVYGLLPSYVMDGVDVSYSRMLNDWHIEYYAGYHRIDVEARRSNSTVVDTAQLHGMTTLMLTGDQGPWRLTGGVSTGKLTYVMDVADTLFDALRAVDPISPGAAALAAQLDARDARYHLYSAGVSYDKDDWLVIGEVARRTFDRSFYRDSDGGYITVGYRLDCWMPYATLARRLSHGPYSDNRAGPLSTFVEDLMAGTRLSQSSLSLGVSREIGSDIVLKTQIQWLQPDRNSWGASLSNQSPGYRPTDPPLFRLISINANMVF